MPPSSKTSKLGAKYGAKANQAVQSHADDETTYGFIELPAGITNGIAQLQQCYFEQYKEGDNKGEYYMRASGVVLEPTEPVPTKTGPMRVAGLTTSIMIPVCETKFGQKVTTQEENISRILLEFRRLGGPEFTSGATIDDLEEMGPYFKFTTAPRIAQRDVPEKNVKKGDVLDGCFHNWHGTIGLEDYEPPAAQSATKVSGGAAASEAKAKQSSATPATNGKAKANGKPAEKAAMPLKKEEEPEEQEVEENEGGEDLDALAADASDQDSETSEESGNRLIELAVEAGIEEDWARKEAQSWDEVVEAIRENEQDTEGNEDNSEEGEGEEGEEGGGDDEAYKPEVGHEVGYCPINPKTKKPVPNPVRCKITKVNEKNETVTLKSGKAEYKDVEWNDLLSLDEVS